MQKGKTFFLILIFFSLTGCLGGVWTGASLVYDRHNVYKKANDYKLSMEVNTALFKDKSLKEAGAFIDMAVFNGDLLLVGHVPELALREEIMRRISNISGFRRVFNQIDVADLPNNSMNDSWITTKIRSQIFADSTIDPNVFKVITSDNIVYLMGDVQPNQATKVIDIARNTEGVVRVVKLFKYYNLSEKAMPNG
ncbi:MAG: BON domain-containing protein [Proteobacteria bacterium]|nr:BON domain-containing protein [Pseudomonadota bacterium]